MKIIKNAREFKIDGLLESVDRNAMYDFKEAVEEVVLNDGFGSSYSILAQNASKDPETDYKKFVSSLSKLGWSESRIKQLFDQQGDEICADYENGGYDAWLCGVMDYFMYKMCGDKITLMGYNTVELDDDGSEYVIKFSYGYNRTPYGMLAMKQHCGSVDEFLDHTGEKFVNQMTVYGSPDLEQIKDVYSYDSSSKTGRINTEGITPELLNELKRVLNYMGAEIGGKPEIRKRSENYSSIDGGWSEISGNEIIIHFK
jgi:hypothetical protein